MTIDAPKKTPVCPDNARAIKWFLLGVLHLGVKGWAEYVSASPYHVRKCLAGYGVECMDTPNRQLVAIEGILLQDLPGGHGNTTMASLSAPIAQLGQVLPEKELRPTGFTFTQMLGIRRLIKEGATQATLAAYFCVSQPVISKRLFQMGVTIETSHVYTLKRVATPVNETPEIAQIIAQLTSSPTERKVL